MNIDVERRSQVHIVRTDEHAALRVAAHASQYEHDLALTLNTATKAQTNALRVRLSTEAEILQENASLYAAIASAVDKNSFAIIPEHNPKPNDKTFVPACTFLCNGAQIPNTSFLTLSTVLDLVMTPKEVGHLLERGQAVEALQKGRIVHFARPKLSTRVR